MLFDIVARILELVVIKFDLWHDGLEDSSSGFCGGNCKSTGFEFIWIITDFQIYLNQEDHVQQGLNPRSATCQGRKP